MSQQDLLDRIETDLRALLEEARAQYARLDPLALQRRHKPEAWNIQENIAHVNKYLEDYIPGLERAIHKAKARRWGPGYDIKYSGRGRRAIRRADPANGKSFKTSKHYNFYQKPIGTEVVKSFIINGERLLRIVEAARSVDINRASVPKAHTWTGKYSVANLLEFLVTHTRRHFIRTHHLLG